MLPTGWPSRELRNSTTETKSTFWQGCFGQGVIAPTHNCNSFTSTHTSLVTVHCAGNYCEPSLQQCI
ncbi:uncharacterized protein YALI1_A16020g [Yarrowia lipolytica]|uniref:Uncharacterized protein n=1 Tax=Yarrowia lipolytica TaxID=4952 RepID=A0A1D8N504_YARLL|nr:hypothetical protein YALI1_A16020g [Yarrowia lipolytica]